MVVVEAVLVASVSDHGGKQQNCVVTSVSDWEGNNTGLVVVAVKSYLMY